MATVYVINAQEDQCFVEAVLLPALPALGFNRWMSPLAATERPTSEAIGKSAAVLVVVSQAAAASEPICTAVSHALASGRTLIPVRIDYTPLGAVHKALP